MDYSFTITPAVSPGARAKLEDRLDGFLATYGGETTGGGTMLDGSESDLDFECDEEGFIEPLKDYIQSNCPFAATITLKSLDDDREIFRVEVTTTKPWWKFW